MSEKASNMQDEEQNNFQNKIISCTKMRKDNGKPSSHRKDAWAMLEVTQRASNTQISDSLWSSLYKWEEDESDIMSAAV